jgi:hypothetical protein
VRSIAFHPSSFAPSTYDGVLLDGAEARPYDTLDTAVAALADVVAERPGPTYAYLYVDTVDAVGHRHGPSSDAFVAETVRCLDAIETAVAALPAGTLLLLAADHGQVDVDPATTVYVNEAWPQIVDLLARGSHDRVLVPAGSARDLFLHCRPEAVDEVIDGLARLLGERATVHRVADVVAAGWLGAVGERLRVRLADVCVLPAPGETVWWRERHRFDMRFRGHHGGLSEEEAQTQVAALVV